MTTFIRGGISCHAWNNDGTLVALSPNSEDVYIYDTKGSQDVSTWVKKWELKEHSGFVSSIDWCHETNQIVTCAHDRNAYVWKLEDDAWKPKLVLLRINRAATQVKWSPDGKKFAVASGAKCVPVCHYEQKNDWWVSKIIKKHKSTVLSVAWCPNNKFIVTGSTDNKCRIFSAFVKEVDTPTDDGFGALWPNQHKFGELLAEFDARAWVHSVAWSPSAFRVAFATHAATLNVIQLSDSQPNVQCLNCEQLPVLDIQFLSDQAIIGGGWDCTPILFTAGESVDSVWSTAAPLEKEGDKKTETKTQSSGFAAARNLFQASVTKGVQIGGDAKSAKEESLKTRHQNTITSVGKFRPGIVSTASIDGNLYFWQLSQLGVDVAALKIQ